MAINDRAGSPSALDAFGFGILDGLVAVVVVSEIIYVFAFNSLPSGLRLDVAGVLLVAQTLLCTWALITRPAFWSILIAVALAIKLLCWSVSTFAGGTPAVTSADLIRISARELVPYVAAIWLLTFSTRLPYRLVNVVVLASSVLAGALALTGEPLQMIHSVRLSPFTGGEGQLGLHSSAYFIIVSLFIVDGYRRTGCMPGKLSIPVLGFLLVVLVGYQVRTAMVMLGAYAIGHAWESRWRRLVLDTGLLALGFTLICAAGALVLTDALSDTQWWGSGRVGSYQFRLALLMQRDLVPLMFGSGPGSDAFVIPVWWWDAKDSHSDLFHTLVEEGVIGLLGMATFLYALWLRLDRVARPLLLSLLVCAAISNGLLGRPTEFFLLIVAMAVVQNRLALGSHSPTALHRDPTPVYPARSRMPWASANGRRRG